MLVIHSVFILRITDPDFLVAVFVACPHASSVFPAVVVLILRIIALGHRWCSGIRVHGQGRWIRSSINIHPTVTVTIVK